MFFDNVRKIGQDCHAVVRFHPLQEVEKERRKSGILVTEIRPGLVNTAMAKGPGLFWVMPVEKVARQIIRAVARKKATAVVTKRWRIISVILKHL